MNTVKTLACAATALSLTVGPSLAVASGLREHKQINDGLLIIAIGDKIQDNCPSIEPRMVKAYFFAKGLEKMAKDDGYSDAQIEEFVEDRGEKNRVKGMADTYLAQRGVVAGDPHSYCTAGKAEIENNSQVGVLLRMK